MAMSSVINALMQLSAELRKPNTVFFLRSSGRGGFTGRKSDRSRSPGTQLSKFPKKILSEVQRMALIFLSAELTFSGLCLKSERLNPDVSSCLCVFNLSPSTTEQFIFNYFSRIGHVKNVKVVYDK